MGLYKEGEPYSAVNLPINSPYIETCKGRTRQEDAKGCNINNIMAKYEKTGLLPVVQREAFFADVSDVVDFRTAQNLIHFAEDAFMELPADVRSKFKNDPALFLDFTSNPANREEMVKMGLLEGVDVDTEVEAAAELAAKVAKEAAEAAKEGGQEEA